MMPAGDGNFYLYLHGDVRRASGTGVGDKVAVEVQFDAEYRNGPMQPMPAWFRAPLIRNSHAKAAWDALDKIPRLQWMDYLRWYRQVLALPVRNGHRVTDLRPRA